MQGAAVLLADPQRDFLGAGKVTGAANAILGKRVPERAIAAMVANRFPAAARIANCFRSSAAMAGS